MENGGGLGHWKQLFESLVDPLLKKNSMNNII